MVQGLHGAGQEGVAMAEAHMAVHSIPCKPMPLLVTWPACSSTAQVSHTTIKLQNKLVCHVALHPASTAMC